ncbi:tyrosine-type recombinase/integrase [Thaumasiovibrio subtropicus]|uniref:tyrosine-type recombinase/integrase n=1 Tax=Thaumasiovibrio subtropicus TaxID=1891207 RepID=UPI000B3581FC|nr:tyrosine-type recombinase/integrase [Thaumasiovibrio subtropicus]
MKPTKKCFLTPVEDIDIWRSVTENKYAHNSLLSLKNDWHHFLSYCHAVSESPLPAHPKVVVRYIDKVQRERKFSTLRRYLISINTMHKLFSQPEPGRFREVQTFMKRCQESKGEDQIQADAFRHSHLEALIKKLEKSQRLKDKRDLAIWSVMLDTMLKRSELIKLTPSHLNKDTAVLLIEDIEYPLSELSLSLLNDWLFNANILDGPLFRSMDRHENVAETAMDPSAVYRVFRRASTLLDLPKHITFSGQSSRVGASKDLSAQGLTLTEIQSAGRWRSPAMPAQYIDNKQKSEREKARYKKKKQWL